jgi:acetolactate synthase-1/2/3 large subunit
MKYSDYFIESLLELGYTHCFFVGGGNIMHLLESARTRIECIAVVNEVSAGIAAEYFNVANRENGRRAFALVTAGPGLTNIVTAVAGAWLESRELLVIGGQARTNLLSAGTIRQVGHQEVAGSKILQPITKISTTIFEPMSKRLIKDFVETSQKSRKGPVFLEICLDVTAMEINPENLENEIGEPAPQEVSMSEFELEKIMDMLQKSQRPLFLVGGGLNYNDFQKSLKSLEKWKIPVATTWNAADYLDFTNSIYAGRPNTYGMRWANAVIQQADLVVAFGARLGLQQTGFAWEDFVPVGEVIRIDIDQDELERENPKSEILIQADAGEVLEGMVQKFKILQETQFANWNEKIKEIRNSLPVVEEATYQFEGYVNPFELVHQLGELLTKDDQVITCSSGGSYTSMMQAFPQHQGQLLTNNKGLASMGYGLAGAIGSAIAFKEKRTILVEGDGGFAQNLSEIGTVVNRKLNLKMFIFSNLGYASIRVSQKTYFEGNYVGCDGPTGVGLPNWISMFDSYGIPSVEVNDSIKNNLELQQLLNTPGPAAFIINIHPDQSFLPKITSRIYSDGKMKSNPIHLMDPQLDHDLAQECFSLLPENLRTV